jgi:hypothetical protein
LCRNRATNSREFGREKLPDFFRFGFLEHLKKCAQLNAIRVRADFLRLGGQLVRAAREFNRRALRRAKTELRMGVRDCGQLQIIVNALATLVVGRGKLDGHFGPVRPLHLGRFFLNDVGAVFLGVDRKDIKVGLRAKTRPADDANGLAGGDEAVHPRGADADALLPARHFQTVELGTVKQLSEDVGD